MKITEILSPEMVVPDLKGSDKPAVLRELAEHMCASHKEIQIGDLVAVLEERERLGSTAIGDGIAIPHGKLKGVKGILGIFGRHCAGVDFDSLDGKPTHLFFLLIAPEDSSSLHLKALARVSRLLKDQPFREHLLAASDPAELYRLIKEEDSRY
jgi:nitrogen PTS system EIIA component